MLSGTKVYRIFLVVFLVLIGINFLFHYISTKNFNETLHTAVADGSGDSYVFDFHPQNGNEVSWQKETNLDEREVVLNACSYECSLTNDNSIALSEWTMRVDITSPCLIHTAWCGKMEIHQNVQGEEKVQTLDLRMLVRDEITLDYHECGDILLFPLQPGDYLIYYPNEAAREFPITKVGDEPSSVVVGLILYWEQDAAYEKPTVTIDYYLNQGFFDGTGANTTVVAAILWLLMVIVGISVRLTRKYLDSKTKAETEKREIERKATEKMLDQMIRALANSIDAKDEYTHGHSERVAEYSLKLAQALHLSNEECKKVFYAGLVHDVGKIGIPSKIINKEGRLTEEEFEIIKTHPSRGEAILSKIEDMPYLAIGAKYHHEKYDGTGYPDGAKGEEIPLLARIIAVADAYDAMTSRRSYRKTLDQRIVKQEIWKGMASQFDPLIAKHMIAMIDADANYDMREKQDESYEMIDMISKKEFWDDYNPKSIKSEDKLMAETDVKYFGQFLYELDDWLKPEKLTEVAAAGTPAEEKAVVVHSRTLEESTEIWDTPIFILYTSKNGEPDGDDYREYSVIYSSGYSWKTGLADDETVTIVRKEAFGSWNHWNEANKNGMDYSLQVRKDKNVTTLHIENDLMAITQKVEIPKEDNAPLYISVSAKYCELRK